MLKFSMKDNELFMQMMIAHCEYEGYSQIIYELEELRKYDESYWEVWSSYIMSLGVYETIKKQFFINEVFPRVDYNYDHWETDYVNSELIIYLYEDSEEDNLE